VAYSDVEVVPGHVDSSVFFSHVADLLMAGLDNMLVEVRIDHHLGLIFRLTGGTVVLRILLLSP